MAPAYSNTCPTLVFPRVCQPRGLCPGLLLQPPALLTLAGDIHAEVHAIDEVHIQGPRLHEHAAVAGGLPATPRVGSFILWPQICLSLNNAATELCAIVESPDQDLWAPVSAQDTKGGSLHLTVHSLDCTSLALGTPGQPGQT